MSLITSCLKNIKKLNTKDQFKQNYVSCSVLQTHHTLLSKLLLKLLHVSNSKADQNNAAEQRKLWFILKNLKKLEI
jgi:hypothetical protein